MQAAGVELPIVWRGRRARAFLPALLAERDLRLDETTAARVAVAATEVGHAAEVLTEDYEPLARLLLRSEGVASSYIEGVAAPVIEIVLAEEGKGPSHPGAASWVASNLAAMSLAVADATGPQSLSLDSLCDWHRTLMSGSPSPARHIGVIRDEQGWIGGTSPLDAHLVTPPPEYVSNLLDDLLAFVNSSDVDPVAQAAVAHAQFEIIHPFTDGNGRVGRLLVAWVLTRRLSLLLPPPVSVAIAADVGGYTSGLVHFRMGDHHRWIQWFAGAVASGGRSQRALVAQVERIKDGWLQQLASTDRKVRSDAAVFAALDLLPRHVVMTSRTLVEELGLSRKAALDTLKRLVALGIIAEASRLRSPRSGQPAMLYVCTELLGLAGSQSHRSS